MRLPVVLAALTLAGVAGCAPLAKDARFADVQTLARERGVGEIRWRPDDADVARELAPLLAAPLTQDDAVRVALLNNRRLRATAESLGVAQAEYARAASWRNPSFDIDVKFPDAGNGKTKIEAGVAASLLDLLRLPARRRVADAVFEADRLRVAGAVFALARDVRLAHLDLQAAGETLELRRTAEKAFGASAELAARLRTAGNITALRAATEQAAFEEARLDTADAELAIGAARERLALLLGLADDAWQVEPRLPALSAAQASQPSNDFDTARRNSLACAAARARTRAAAEAAGIADTAGFLHDLDVGLVTERETDGQWLTGPSLSVPLPLFDWGQIARTEAGARLRQAVATEQALATELAAKLRTQTAQAAAGRAAAERYHAVLLPLQQAVVAEAQQQYNGMLIDAFNLLAARRHQVAVAARYVSALRNAHQARVRLAATLVGTDAGETSIVLESSYSEENGVNHD